MNYKRKKPAYRKFRYLRRGCNGLGKDQIQKQIRKDHFDSILEAINEYRFFNERRGN